MPASYVCTADPHMITCKREDFLNLKIHLVLFLNLDYCLCQHEFEGLSDMFLLFCCASLEENTFETMVTFDFTSKALQK